MCNLLIFGAKELTIELKMLAFLWFNLIRFYRFKSWHKLIAEKSFWCIVWLKWRNTILKLSMDSILEKPQFGSNFATFWEPKGREKPRLIWWSCKLKLCDQFDFVWNFYEVTKIRNILKYRLNLNQNQRVKNIIPRGSHLMLLADFIFLIKPINQPTIASNGIKSLNYTIKLNNNPTKKCNSKICQ